MIPLKNKDKDIGKLKEVEENKMIVRLNEVERNKDKEIEREGNIQYTGCTPYIHTYIHAAAERLSTASAV